MMPIDWVNICVVSLNKGKEDKCDCTSFKSINLLSAVSKVYDKVLVKRIRESTEGVSDVIKIGLKRDGMHGSNIWSETCIQIIFSKK